MSLSTKKLMHEYDHTKVSQYPLPQSAVSSFL